MVTPSRATPEGYTPSREGGTAHLERVKEEGEELAARHGAGEHASPAQVEHQRHAQRALCVAAARERAASVGAGERVTSRAAHRSEAHTAAQPSSTAGAAAVRLKQSAGTEPRHRAQAGRAWRAWRAAFAVCRAVRCTHHIVDEGALRCFGQLCAAQGGRATINAQWVRDGARGEREYERVRESTREYERVRERERERRGGDEHKEMERGRQRKEKWGDKERNGETFDTKMTKA